MRVRSASAAGHEACARLYLTEKSVGGSEGNAAYPVVSRALNCCSTCSPRGQAASPATLAYSWTSAGDGAPSTVKK